MNTSFIIFNIIVLIVVVIAAFRLGVKVSKASEKESPDAKNPTPYEQYIQ